MHIGKSTKMAGMDKSNLNLGPFVNPPTREPANPWLRMIKNRLSVAQWSVDLDTGEMKYLGARYPCDKSDGHNVDHGPLGAKWRSRTWKMKA
jgi:hypothetical protein